MIILLAGKGFSEMTCCIGGDGILNSVTLNGPLAFSGMTFCTGGDAIEVSVIGNDGKTCSDVTSCIGGKGIVHETMGCGIGGPFSISSILFKCS